MASGVEVDDSVLRRLATLIGGLSMHEVIDAYLDDAPKQLGDFRRGLETGDFELARRSAHTLKSTAGSLGARRFAGLCDQVEAAARVGDAERLRALLPQLEARLSLVLKELRRESR